MLTTRFVWRVVALLNVLLKIQTVYSSLNKFNFFNNTDIVYEL